MKPAVILFFCLWSILLFAQKKKIEIISTKTLQVTEINGVALRKLIGNVKLKQKDIILCCDSALFYKVQNRVNAFGHVYIRQGDSLHIFSDRLEYNGNTRQAELHENVRLKSADMNLSTDELHYDLKERIATYYTGATIHNKATTLTSRRGSFHAKSSDMFFKEDVTLKNPKYELFTDTLRYNIRTDIAYFYAQTTIKNKENTILCNNGWYDTDKGISFFTNRAVIFSDSRIITADTIYYDQVKGYGEAHNRVHWVDTVDNFIINSNYAEYFDSAKVIMATKKAILTNILDGDSLYLSADTLRSFVDSTYRIFFAYYRVKIFKNDLQGVCDSLVYDFKDSTLRFYREPVLWTDDNQMTADTINLQIKNQQLYRLNLRQNAFICSHPDTLLFNQIKGKNIYGYFVDGKLAKMFVEGNGESIYYADDDSGAYVGLNKAICTDIYLYFKEGGMDRITYITSPEATFYPIADIHPDDFRLKGFTWQEKKKPVSKESLLKD